MKILIPAPNQKITLHAIVAQESTIDKMFIFCKFKDKHSWCSTKKYAYFKAKVKYDIVYYRRDGNDRTSYLNIATPTLYLQKEL